MKQVLRVVSAVVMFQMFSVLTTNAQQYADGFRGTNAAVNSYFMGKVGVGTSTPAIEVDVAGSVRASGQAIANGYFCTGRSANNDILFAGNSSMTYYFGNYYFSGGAKYSVAGGSAAMYMGVAAQPGDISFLTAPSAAAGAALTLTERMRIKEGGNVGIGTASPSDLLHVAGYGRFDGGVKAAGFYSTGRSTNNDVVFAGGNDYTYFFGNYFYSGSAKRSVAGGSAAMLMGVTSDPGDIVFQGAPTGVAGSSLSLSETMRIKQNGKVGVGTATPSETLHVAGTIRADLGIAYVKPLGDLAMGSFTNAP